MFFQDKKEKYNLVKEILNNPDVLKIQADIEIGKDGEVTIHKE